MPIELAASQPVQIPAPIIIPFPRERTLVLVGQLVAVLLLTGLWVGVQETYASMPSDAQQSIAGP